jgi:hypothetical protein
MRHVDSFAPASTDWTPDATGWVISWNPVDSPDLSRFVDYTWSTMYPLWTEMTVTVQDDGVAKSATINSAANGGPVTWTDSSPVANVLKLFPAKGTLLMSRSGLDNAVQSLFGPSDATDVTKVSV